MKDQYFADSRDYFKYDLLLELLDTMAFPGGLTYIPMLTAPDGSGHGRLTSYECGSVDRPAYLSRIRQDLANKLGIADPVCVSDNQVAFFVMAKADHRAARARETTERYSNRRGHPFFSV